MNYHLRDRPCIECNKRPRQCDGKYCRICADELLKHRFARHTDMGPIPGVSGIGEKTDRAVFADIQYHGRGDF